MALRESVIVPLVLGVAAVATAITTVALHAAEVTQDKDGKLQWILLALGVVGILVAVFDRAQTPAGARTRVLVGLLGPTGARISFAVIGGGFLGGAIALLT